jgi:hypothetical protein
MAEAAYIFRLRHARGNEVSVVTRDGKTFAPDHGWGRGSLSWEEHTADVRAALRGEASAFVVITSAVMTVHDHTALQRRRQLAAPPLALRPLPAIA